VQISHMNDRPAAVLSVSFLSICRQAGMGLPMYGLDLDKSNPDFVALAEAYGAKGHRVTGPDQFGSVLQHCLSTPGCVHVVEVPIDYASSSHLQVCWAPVVDF